jgi:5-methyltetrahydropteroyltriglutamate--homocysteine methyltransferase
MKTSQRRILTTHSGSLPRLQNLREMLAARAVGGPVDVNQFDAAVRASVQDVVERQRTVGIDVINDGESSKATYRGYVTDRLSGFQLVETVAAETTTSAAGGGVAEESDFPEYFARRAQLDEFVRRRGAVPKGRVCCTGPLEWKDFSPVEKDIANLKQATQHSDAEEVFMSAVAPPNVCGIFPNLHYATDDDYLHAVCEAMRREYEAIVDAGFVLQLDYPGLTRGIAQDIEAINFATRNIPADRMRIHVCWGSDERPHHLDPELRTFVNTALQARAAGLTIVAANGRHEHEWSVWRDIPLPEGKVIIPGVIDSTTNIIEHPHTVAERIVRFVEVLGAEHFVAGVDCGFQTTVGRDQVDPKVAWAKLGALAEGARLASHALFAAGAARA